jgi:transcriptional regulator with XRE-family HTH domain
MVKDRPSTDMFKNLGPALILLRELRGLSQAEVARRAGVGKSRVSKYEKGRESPKLASLQRMLEVLDVRQDAFFSVVAFLDRLPEALSALPGAPVPPFAMVPSTASFLPLDEAFADSFKALFSLHRQMLEMFFNRLSRDSPVDPGATDPES